MSSTCTFTRPTDIPTVSDIARRIGRSQEEVQLILDLEKIAVN